MKYNISNYSQSNGSNRLDLKHCVGVDYFQQRGIVLLYLPAL